MSTPVASVTIDLSNYVMMKRILCLAAALLPLVCMAQENPIATISQQPGLCSIIQRWGFVGDSLCSGEHEYTRADGTKVYHDIYEYSWGQRMVAAIGGAAVGYNFSQGGETAKGWIEHFWNYPLNRNADISARQHPCQAYIIALGCNDRNKFETGNAATDIDLSDYTRNADTFIGYYGGIIQRIKSLVPGAHIFVVTIPTLTGNEEFSAEIRKLPGMFDRTWLIDLEKYGLDFTDPELKSRYFLMGHMNAAGYQLMAWVFMTYINWIIEHNMEAFSDIALI